MDLRYGLAQPHGMPPRVARGPSKLAAIMVFHFGGSEWTQAFRRHHFSRQKRTDGYASITYTVSRMYLITLDLLHFLLTGYLLLLTETTSSFELAATAPY
jgi:hypothetical protein